jgi:putative flavoprotein involved in K+ transport
MTAFPAWSFDGAPDAFVPKDKVADYFAAYAEKIAAPIRCGVEVRKLRRNAGRPGFRHHLAGRDRGAHVVVATGPFQRPIIPALIPQERGRHPDAFQRLSQSRPAARARFW